MFKRILVYLGLVSVKEIDKPNPNYYNVGYTDGVSGIISSLDYVRASNEDLAEYAQGYADGILDTALGER